MSSCSLFFSYNWGKDRENVEKLRVIYDKAKREIANLNIWWDQNELKVDDWKKKVYNGILSSDIVVVFVTRDYCNSENAMKELSFAIKLKKFTMFYVNENVEKMTNEQIIYEVFQDVAFDLGNQLYFKKPDDLINAIKIKLAAVKKDNNPKPQLKLLKDTNVFISFDVRYPNTVKPLVTKIKEIFKCNYHKTDALDELQNDEKIKKADLILIFFNEDYIDSEYCRKEFRKLKDKRNLLKLNFFSHESKIMNDLFSDLADYIISSQNSIEFHKDKFRTMDLSSMYKGEGPFFNELVFKMQSLLPTVLDLPRYDVAVVGPKKEANDYKEQNQSENQTIATLSPEDSNFPNFQVLNESALILVLLTNLINKSEKSLTEIEYSSAQNKTKFLVIAVAEDKVHPMLSEIIDKNSAHLNFKKLESLKSANFTNLMSEAINHKRQENAYVQEIVEKLQETPQASSSRIQTPTLVIDLKNIKVV